ncbi:MAG TPA: HD domain-containing protein [Acidimicrobiales bacterium]|nr:HD domain-containing protein [Acidimicrobiales bacterium]
MEQSAAEPHPPDPDAAEGFTPLSERFDEALRYASWAHRRQARKATRIPYVAHLLGVCGTVLEHGGSEDQAIAALLHDVLEDCGAEHEAPIRDSFGDGVADIVVACSDSVLPAGETKPPWKERKTRYLEHLRRSSASEPAVLVSLADKVNNARAIRVDLTLLGPAVWGRFTRPKGDQLWYYAQLASAFEAVLPGALADELASIFTDIVDLSDAESR